MLASDRERQATVLRLQAAHLEGRLQTDELEERIGRAEAARSREELDSVEADLPERPGTVVEPTTGVPWIPGRRHFSERKLLNAPVDDVRESALAFIVPSLERHAYLLSREHRDSLTFNDPHHPAAQIIIRFRDAGDRRTLVMAHGIAPLAIRRAFARLSD